MSEGWLRSPLVRRRLLIAAIPGGCFLWAMIILGLSFAMVEHGGRQWWVVPVFGLLVLVTAVVAVRGISRPEQAAAAPAPHRAAPARVPVEPLSPRELDVLGHLAAGRSNREIAKALFIAPGTVKAHLSHIFRKLDAGSRLQAVAHARAAGLLE